MDVAKVLLKKGIECDQDKRRREARYWYMKGIDTVLAVSSDKLNNEAFMAKIQVYQDRVKSIDENLQNFGSTAHLVKSIQIKDGDCGNSYGLLFSAYITDTVREVQITEPYLTERYQLYNLVAFLEVLLKYAKNVKFIEIVTKPCTKQNSCQDEAFQQIKLDLDKRDITLVVEFNVNQHDRKIIMDNGYIIKSGFGLDIFKPKRSLFSMGLIDYEFRHCKQTDIDILNIEV